MPLRPILKKTAPMTPVATKSEEIGASFNFDLILIRNCCNLSLNITLTPNSNREGSTITRLYPIIIKIAGVVSIV